MKSKSSNDPFNFTNIYFETLKGINTKYGNITLFVNEIVVIGYTISPPYIPNASSGYIYGFNYLLYNNTIIAIRGSIIIELYANTTANVSAQLIQLLKDIIK
ncbi:hypothetical protein [Sulfurisphaera javensis]|uniref:hypothetical protein n=1 Tax=Sulfurisphaera javensis TaxID=2049879 RepID=UPI0034E85268